jgi:hypothetical protein
MSATFELKQFVVRDLGTGVVVEGAEVGVFLDTGTGGKGTLASSSQVFNVAGAGINQGTTPILTDASGIARFRLAPGTYFVEVTFGATTITRPGLTAGNASARNVGTGAQDLPLPGNIPAALLGRAPNAGDAGQFFVFNGSGGYVLGALLEITPATGRAASRVLQLNGTSDGLVWVDLPPGVLPVLTGEAGKVLVVNDDEDGTEWRDPPEVVYPAFSSRAGWLLRVNSGETDVEWWNPDQPVTIAEVTAAGNRSLTQGDRNTILRSSGSNTVNFLLPANATTAIAVGSLFTIMRTGTGQCSVTAASGVTINGVSAMAAVLPDQWDAVTLVKIATNDWHMAGKFEVP